jgi:hypothetical protein
MSMQRIEGNTYPIRRELHLLGARWNSQDKHWWIEEDRLAEANALVKRVPPAKPKKPFICRCPVCGSEFDVNNRPVNELTNQ